MRRRGMIGLLVEVIVLSVVAGVATFALVQFHGPQSDNQTAEARAAAAEAPTVRALDDGDLGPVVIDNQGQPLTTADATVVRAVHAALAAGNLELLRSLYAGNDWAGQLALLGQPAVREQVLTLLRTHPANLGEGYVYPAFASFGWGSETDLADGRLLGVDPASLPDPTQGYRGLETAFFLDTVSSGALQWRGIRQRAAGMS